jgi:hypothetical protein
VGISITSDVIEDHGHPLVPPDLALTTELTDGLLEPSLVEALLQSRALASRALDEQLLKGAAATGMALATRPVSVEVAGIDPPQGNVLLERPPVSAVASIPEVAQGLGPRVRRGDRCPKFLLSEASPVCDPAVLRQMGCLDLPAAHPFPERREVLPVHLQVERAQDVSPAFGSLDGSPRLRFRVGGLPGHDANICSHQRRTETPLDWGHSGVG